MIIVYNPPTGSKVEKFVYQGMGELEPHGVGELKQYQAEVAKALINNFGFLEEVTPARAQEILAKPKEAAFKCEYCDFSTSHKVALSGHLRSHQGEIAKGKEPQIDPTLVPVAQATPVAVRVNTQEATKDVDNMTGPEWYGSGLTETRRTL